ncbi:MAG: hypothetical protein RLZZ612_895 [Pseudomonadota bacterium]|jgi:uncharacterized protein (TIGR02099 family)
MSLFSPSISFPWRGAAVISRLLLWLVVGVWLVFAFTWSAIHWVIVPRIGEWRSHMEALATRSVGIPVRLGEIRAESNAAIPTIEINDLRLLDPQGRDALVLHRVVVSLSVKSIWRLGFEQVLVERPELDIRRTPQGRIRIAGLDVMAGATPTSTTPTDAPDASFPAGAEASSVVANWLFSQPEFAIVGGRIRWTDEWHKQAPIHLEQVNFVLRNPGRRHLARLDAVPSDGMGQKFSLRFQMRSPLLSLHPGQWREWSGEAYGEFPRVDLARLSVAGQIAQPLGLTVHEGQGALRVWVQAQRGQPVEVTSDLALHRLHASWASTVQPLELRDLSGRIQIQQHTKGWELATQRLNFLTPNGIAWKDGVFRLRHHGLPSATTPAHEFEANHINLAAVRELALGLPFPKSLLAQLQALEPEGTIETLRLNWKNDLQEPSTWASFQTRGRATGLALKAQAVTAQAAQDPFWMGRPGFQGAAVEFDFHHAGGQAKLSLAPHGQLEFPGVFDEPVIPMHRFSAEAKWTLKGEQIQVQLSQVRFANADAEGQAQATWTTSDPQTSPSHHRFPGILQLEGQLSRGKGERVHRYLPRGIPADVRQYVKESVLSAVLSDVRFKVAGDLHRFPFEKPADGEFRIQAKVQQAHYAYIPPMRLPSPHLQWPAFRQLEGDLRFNGMGMSLDVKRALVDQAPSLRVVQGQAKIAHFARHPTVEVGMRIEGSLADALRVVHRSPLAEMTGEVLRPVRATGAVQIQLGLNVPLLHTPQTTVKGQLNLLGNDVQWHPESPTLGRARGVVEFTQDGFFISQATARFLGGDLQFSGGMKSNSEGPMAYPSFKGQGSATAEGLRQAGFLGWTASLAEYAQGQTPYTVQLGFKHRLPQLELQSSLQGLALALPAPMNKAAEVSWPLQVSLTTSDPSDHAAPRWQTLHTFLNSPEGPRFSLWLQRDLQAPNNAGFSRGVVRVGSDSSSTPPSSWAAKGWSLQVAWPELNADAWQQWLTKIADTTTLTANQGNTKRNEGRGNAAAEAWLPDRVGLKTERLTLASRRFQGVDVDAQRQGGQWQANVHTREMSGQLHYHMAQSGRAPLLKARLEKLTLPPHWGRDASPQGTETGATSTPTALTSSHLPDLDVAIEALEMEGRAWGRLELQATNQAQPGRHPDWQLTLLKLRVPEASLTATGRWGGVEPNVTATTVAWARRTDLDFELDVQDSGLLLRRFGMAGVFKGGKGQLTGRLGWPGSPMAMSSSHLSGHIELDIASGQFLKADPGLAKLLGVLSLQSLPRRLTLDFSDVFAQGFSFDFIRGDARIQQGVAYTNNLQMKGVNAAVLMEGKADINQETQDLRVLVVPELNAGTASLIATVINPAVGLGTFLAQALLRQPLIRATTQTFRVHGSWSDPQVEKTALPPASSPTPAQ